MSQAIKQIERQIAEAEQAHNVGEVDRLKRELEALKRKEADAATVATIAANIVTM